MTKLKRLAQNANSFTANGQKYLIHPSLSVRRFREFEKIQVTLGFNADHATLAAGIRKAYDALQTLKAADASVTLYNLLDGITKKMDDREHEMLLLCSLFIGREGENLAEWSEAEAIEKIQDWKNEGFDVTDFFGLAWRFVKGFTERFIAGLPDSSENDTPTTDPNSYAMSPTASATATISG